MQTAHVGFGSDVIWIRIPQLSVFCTRVLKRDAALDGGGYVYIRAVSL